MFTSFLAIITMAVASGQGAPQVVAPFKSEEACSIQATKLNKEHAAELLKEGAAFACLTIQFPTI